MAIYTGRLINNLCNQIVHMENNDEYTILDDNQKCEES